MMYKVKDNIINISSYVVNEDVTVIKTKEGLRSSHLIVNSQRLNITGVASYLVYKDSIILSTWENEVYLIKDNTLEKMDYCYLSEAIFEGICFVAKDIKSDPVSFNMQTKQEGFTINKSIFNNLFILQKNSIFYFTKDTNIIRSVSIESSVFHWSYTSSQGGGL